MRLFIARGGGVDCTGYNKEVLCLCSTGRGRRSYDCKMHMGRPRSTKVKQTSVT